MTIRATSGFEITGWDENTVSDSDGTRIFRTSITKTFTGDLVGTSTGEMTMAVTEAGAAAYVGFERITAELAGQSGSFVLHHNATGDSAGGSGSWTILPNSGAGKLTGISGQAEITRHADGSHTFVLDYEI